VKGSLPAGHILGGRFLVERCLGKGGMGEVYAAKHVSTGHRVALKILIEARTKPDSVARFLREAQAASAIRHPNVIQVQDVFDDSDGFPVMVMELLEGETLAQYREKVGTLSLDDATAIMLPVAQALLATHQKGIVHRDLKPDNIFIARSEAAERTVKVLDFGIAKLMDPDGLNLVTQTNTGAVLGTPHYMSREQANGERVDQRTDLWSFAVVFVEALSGKRPLHYESIPQMYTSFLQEEVQSAAELVRGLPPDVAAVLDACLAKQRQDRLDNFGPVVEVLEKCSALNAIALPRTSPPSSPRASRKIFRFAVAAGVLLSAGAAAVIGEQQSNRETAPSASLPVLAPVPPRQPNEQEIGDTPRSAQSAGAVAARESGSAPSRPFTNPPKETAGHSTDAKRASQQRAPKPGAVSSPPPSTGGPVGHTPAPASSRGLELERTPPY